MHKNTTKCNKTQSKWCINKHGASKIIDTFETYHGAAENLSLEKRCRLFSRVLAAEEGVEEDGGPDALVHRTRQKSEAIAPRHPSGLDA
jgi:hypothetical protein